MTKTETPFRRRSHPTRATSPVRPMAAATPTRVAAQWARAWPGPSPESVRDREVLACSERCIVKRMTSALVVYDLKHFAVIVLLLLNFTYLYTVANGIFSQCCCLVLPVYYCIYGTLNVLFNMMLVQWKCSLCELKPSNKELFASLLAFTPRTWKRQWGGRFPPLNPAKVA